MNNVTKYLGSSCVMVTWPFCVYTVLLFVCVCVCVQVRSLTTDMNLILEAIRGEYTVAYTHHIYTHAPTLMNSTRIECTPIAVLCVWVGVFPHIHKCV